ncbi:MAG: biotin synthase BioB [Candidatus Omnitrophica bacterium]|nr:biotin synthase BioB [Candidatus Omnitrophota bacterium]
MQSPLSELLIQANKIRQKFLGQELELCSILNAKSGSCGEDCKFCAQSHKHRIDISTYPLKTKQEIIAAAKAAKAIGAKKFGIVTSGNRLTAEELAVIISSIVEIKDNFDITVCGSLGALPKSDLEKLKQSGLVRYHHNIETSENFYPRIVSTHSFKERVDTIKAAKEVGLEVCSGGIVGMGESWQDRFDMAYILKELNADSVPINFLVPIKGTPLESIKPITYEDAIRTICIFRIILKDKIIKIAAGRETILKDHQSQGFMAGANGMLIGGYLTVKGQKPKEDYKLIKQIEDLWRK